MGHYGKSTTGSHPATVLSTVGGRALLYKASRTHSARVPETQTTMGKSQSQSSCASTATTPTITATGKKIKPQDFVLTIHDEPRFGDAPWNIRLKRLLKAMLRGYGMRCTRIVPAIPDSDHPTDNPRQGG